MALIALGAAPFPSLAQQQDKVWRIGCVWIATQKLVKPYEDSVLAGLHEHGYDVGRNLVFEARYADGDARRLPALIDELISLQPDVLLGIGQSAALMKARPSRIPIVVTLGLDPVESGLAKSLSHPGGNVTGIATLYEELVAKQIEILGELVPKLSSIALLSDASDPAAPRYTEYAQKGARLRRASLVSIPVRDQAGIEAAFAQFRKKRPDGLMVALSGTLYSFRDAILRGASALRLPALYPFEGFVDAGGLVSYAENLFVAYRRSGAFVDRIFRGANPADLPFEQPVKFQLAINLPAAKALGLVVPQSVLLRADRVIE